MPKKATLLIVDDDRQVLASMADWLRQQGYDVDIATNLSDARAILERRRFQILLLDMRLGDADGLAFLPECRQQWPDMAVILITGYGTAEIALEAMRAGALEVLTKPIIDEELEFALERALHQQKVIQENEHLKKQLNERYSLENIIGRDPRMQRVYDMIEAVADTRSTVLITGESGTGKSLIARAIHRLSSRRNKPFVEVACGALPETLLESELFGHVAGAFTGATSDKIGKFMQADGGTIFLDEIGTASPALQVKLLRVLQDFEFEPVGSTKTYTVDVRVILATNEDLAQAVAEGRFRRDLYYRINVINIELPPLRERVSDIPLLAAHFLKQFCQETGRRIEGFTPEAMRALQIYSWPGNVRELQNVIERAVLLGKGPLIDVADLPPNVVASVPPALSVPSGKPLKQALSLPERQIILEALEAHKWNRQAAAKALGINRTTLYKKMKRLGLMDAGPPRRAPLGQS